MELGSIGKYLTVFMTVTIQHDCWVLNTLLETMYIYIKNLSCQYSTKGSGGTFRKRNLQEVISSLGHALKGDHSPFLFVFGSMAMT